MSVIYQDMNKALHAMAAHLHRYASELSSISSTVSHISMHHAYVYSKRSLTSRNETEFDKLEQNLNQILSQLQAVQNFEGELEKKIQNILALVSRIS